ncbi:hypothetical protein [Cochleicola gelatinilyticus]|uniref:Uncharacterized protein n=1 Tax=Cochleicola gelatinilyticus TaxID=1763537 RepID=A0A167J1A0_9FLAO|nr:hypothetical protein [Cochleicola gelatinilyticus]OAB80223.1 hypothetical protein ULVI_05670 [Cochleicola gelatinilyticus]
MAIFISVLILAAYFFLIYKSIGAFILEIRKLPTTGIIVYFLTMLLPGFYLVWILHDEKFVYYWDLSGYWIRAIDFTELYFEKPFVAFEEVYNTIRHAEYNFLANLFIAPLNKLFGLSFGWYVFSIYVIYFLPAVLLVSNIIILTLRNVTSLFQKLSLPFLCLLFTPLLIPIRFGFIDSIGLVLIFIILISVLKSDFLRKFNYKSAIAIGILMLVLVFSRRWYAFWATAFYVSLFLTNVIYAIWNREWKPFKNAVLNLTIGGIVPLSIMLLFFYPFFEMSVLKDYGDIYSAYRRAVPLGQLQNAINFFGWGLLVIFLIMTLIQARQQKFLTLFLGINSIIIIALFTRINDFGGYQHYYLLLPMIVIFTMRGLLLVRKKAVIVLTFFAFLAINNAQVFTHSLKFNDTLRIFSQVDGASKIRADYDEIVAISNAIINYEKEGASIYMLTSSREINDNIVKNSKLPELRNEFKKLHITQHVDKRDHFPNELFSSDYVVVTDPAQYHLGEKNQQVIGYFNNAILNGSLKPHYKIVQTYHLNKGITAYIMKKTSGFNKKEIDSIRNFFKSKFPEYPKMFDVKENILRSFEILEGDGYGNVEFLDNQTIKMFPGKKRNSTISFTVSPLDKNLSFVTSFYDKQEIENNCNVDKDGEVQLIIKGDGEILEQFSVSHKKEIPVLVEIVNITTIQISVDKGKYEDYCDFFILKNFRFNK